MSTAAASTDESLGNFLFDYPGADIILLSQDNCHFRVPKTSIVGNFPILGDVIRTTSKHPHGTNTEAPLPVVQLSESGEIIHCLLTFIFPVSPLVPSTPEETMELLSAAQRYQMGSVLTRIRDRIARHYPLPIRLEQALRIYDLAQKFGLRPEALQTARTILNYPITFEGLDGKLDNISGASLYELWKYHERVQAVLASDLTEFRMTCASRTITGLRCTELSSSQIPSWLDNYIESIGNAPNLFDLVEFNIAMVRHIKDGAIEGCECASIPGQTIREFWEALSSVVVGSFEKAESALSLVHEREDPPAHIDSTMSPPNFDVPDANFVIRSFDNVDFRVHKSILALASPFFRDLLSLPQPSDGEIVDGLPLVQLSESSELLNSLISILYPVSTVMPSSYDKVLYLLAACQKYDMVSVQSFIRAEISRGASPVPEGAEAFTAYAIASAKQLIPETEYAARLTLDHPMTFEVIGEGLRLFEGWALRDLVNFRKRCKENLVTCLGLFCKAQPFQPSFVWIGCPDVERCTPRGLPKWLHQFLAENCIKLYFQTFASPLDIHSRICDEYWKAIQTHLHCNFCLGVHATKGLTFCTELKDKLVQARDKVCSDVALTLVRLVVAYPRPTRNR